MHVSFQGYTHIFMNNTTIAQFPLLRIQEIGRRWRNFRFLHTWWKSSNGSIFRVTGHLCREFTGARWIPAQRPLTRSFDVFFDPRLNKRLSKQSWGWWFKTLSRPLWRHCYDMAWCYHRWLFRRWMTMKHQGQGLMASIVTKVTISYQMKQLRLQIFHLCHWLIGLSSQLWLQMLFRFACLYLTKFA